MDQRTALVTGGSRGIGESIVQRLVSDGYFVYFTYNRSHDKAKLAESKLNEFGDKVKAIKLSLSNRDDQENLFDNIRSGHGKIDLLINNAGIVKDVLYAKMREEDWEELLDINLHSIFRLTKPALDLMMPLNKGCIINMSSVSAIRGAVGQCNYSAAKAAIIAFTKSLAREVSNFNIRVNAIAPGYIDTDMTRSITGTEKRKVLQTCLLRRFGTGEEIANVVSFLSSDQASYIQGQVLVVDGGVLL